MLAAVKIHSRLTEVEKIILRGASPGKLEHLALTRFNCDFPLVKDEEKIDTIKQVLSMCELEDAVKSASNEFGKTWLF